MFKTGDTLFFGQNLGNQFDKVYRKADINRPWPSTGFHFHCPVGILTIEKTFLFCLWKYNREEWEINRL